MCNTRSQSSQKAAVQQTYRFEFGSDEKVYSTSFRGAIPGQEICGILGSARNSLYEKCGQAIRAYLDSRNLAYSKFTVKEKLVQVTSSIKFAGKLLHEPSCSVVDRWVGGTKNYYAVFDCRN